MPLFGLFLSPDAVVVVVVVVSSTQLVGSLKPPENKSNRLAPPPMGEFISSMLLLPVTLLMEVLSSFACKTAPQLKQRDWAGRSPSTRFPLLLFFITVAGAPQFGHSPFTVFKEVQIWKPTVATRGRRNANTKNELKIPRTNPPRGETKNPITNNNVTAPFAISAISLLPPPPPPLGGRLYMDKLVGDGILALSGKDARKVFLVDAKARGENTILGPDFDTVDLIENAFEDDIIRNGARAMNAARNPRELVDGRCVMILRR